MSMTELTSISPEARLEQLGLRIPEVAVPAATYVPAVQTGRYIHTLGQLRFANGTLLHTGKAGDTVSLEQAQAAAAQSRC